MEFLYRLYSNNYFGIGLFIVITVLAFAFLIILFFGKKDEKARMEQAKLEENKEQTIPVSESIKPVEELKTESLETMSLEDVPSESLESEPETEIEEPTFTAPVEENRMEEPVSSLKNTYTADDLGLDFDTDFDETIEEELPVMDRDAEENKKLDIFNINPNVDMNDDFDNEPMSYQEDYENYQEQPVRDSFDYPVYEEENDNQQMREENVVYEEPVVEPRREAIKKPMPSVFSSVYKNNEREDIFPETNYQEENTPINLEPETFELKEEKNSYEEPKEEGVQEVRPITPKKPEFVMPKRADMPKLNKSVENNNDSIIKF